MARKRRMSVLKRQREAQKRAREMRKAEKAALKRARRHGNKAGTAMATQEELVGLGILPPPPTDEKEEEEETESLEK